MRDGGKWWESVSYSNFQADFWDKNVLCLCSEEFRADQITMVEKGRKLGQNIKLSHFYEKTRTFAFFTVKLNRLVKVFLRIKQSVWLFPCCWGFYSFFWVLLHFLKYLKIRENPDSRIFCGKTFLLMSYWTILTLHCLEAVTWGSPAKKALLKITQNLKKSISVRVSYLMNLQATGVIV